MHWRLEQLDKNGIKGWVYDPDNPGRMLQVFALRGGTIVGRAVACEKRPALAKSGHPTEACGFSIPPDGKDPAELVLLCMNALPGGKDIVLYSPDKKAIGTVRESRADQSGEDFERAKRLASLKLPDLKGMKVLDLGCGEGFFSLHALSQGAARVVGVDSSDWCIEKAKTLVPDYAGLEAKGRVSFLRTSWWNVPDERFDLILLLSSIHEEPRQKELLDFLSTRLAPGGVLLLECGVVRQAGKSWISLAGKDTTHRFPTEELLLHTLLSRYGVRYVGQSAMRTGIPAPHNIYFCTAKKSVVLIVRGPGGSGKSVVSGLLGEKDIPVMSSDFFFTRYGGALADKAPKTPLYECIQREMSGKNLHKAGRLFMENDLVDEFCREFASLLPLEEPLICVEGEVFAHAEIFERLTTELRLAGAVVWDVTPGDPVSRRCMEETYRNVSHA